MSKSVLAEERINRLNNVFSSILLFIKLRYKSEVKGHFSLNEIALLNHTHWFIVISGVGLIKLESDL